MLTKEYIPLSDRQKAASFSWKYISMVLIVLIYGTSLLLSQVNSLYINHKTYDRREKEQSVLFKDEFQSSEETTNNLILETSTNNDKKPLTFKDVRNGTFYPEIKEIQWIQTPTSLTNDSGDYIVVENHNYYLKSLLDSEKNLSLYELGDTINYNDLNYSVEGVTFSNDLKLAVLTCNKRHNWRHSYFASYFIYDVESKNIEPIISTNEKENSNIALSIISPDSQKIAYILENNVYLKDVSNFENPKTTQITFDGSAQIFNGKPDWVYEEEVFESDTALWWSPDSSNLVILRSNDTEVPIFPIPYFVQQNPGNSSSYPIIDEIKYPKAGFQNPIVDILIYNVENDILKSLPDSDPFHNDSDIDNTDRLITEITWVGNDQVLIRVTNRESDILKIFIVSCPKSSDLELSSFVSRFEDGRGDKSWFEITHNTIHIPKSNERELDGYIDMIGVDGYDHLAYFSPPNASEPKVYLTNGEWEVVEGAAAFDYVNDKVYFISTEKSSIERHVYSVNLDGTSKKNITDITLESWFDVSFSKGARYLLLSYEGPNVPYQKLLDLYNESSEIFTDNKALKNILNEYDIPQINYGNITLDENLIINYKETLPLNFDPKKKYPLLFFVYGGPGSQLVQKSFAVSFSSVIAAELNAVVVTIDGRGTGFKGKKFRNIVRDNLGNYEVLDQISAAKYWISKGYIDTERTAIWGWSYGGYMTLKTLEYDEGNVFKYGMSVAPVTDWRFYDSVYTERYMHTPQNNLEGYENSKVHNVTNFKSSKRFLLMHGTGDDNVHFQNSLQFIDMLDIAGVENYDMYVFPDSDHSIRWHNAGLIVYDRLFTWLSRAFGGEFEQVYSVANYGGQYNGVIDGRYFMDLYG
ncbi:hypothetical protein C6P40_005321 [Pichia californica]|uniref:Dipeptidyl aminopeptidase B n=1 Tax=Pichia californica TaxID=460514 RepID=A0A9P6WLD6_9ASCO|nr:hypothetical protein C6P42_000117 [[Candida] californica]KAG0689265.1 hypothetical protein C6P40_005321 [[Candida] californica]